MSAWFRQRPKRHLRFDAVGAWEIGAPPDKAAFIRALAELLPAGSRLVLENTTFAEEVRAFLESQQPENPPRVTKGTIWPRSHLFHLPATPENLDELARLFGTYIVPEICCHLHAYHENVILLQWWDFDSDDPWYLASSVDVNVLGPFCRRLGCAFRGGGD